MGARCQAGQSTELSTGSCSWNAGLGALGILSVHCLHRMELGLGKGLGCHGPSGDTLSSVCRWVRVFVPREEGGAAVAVLPSQHCPFPPDWILEHFSGWVWLQCFRNCPQMPPDKQPKWKGDSGKSRAVVMMASCTTLFPFLVSDTGIFTRLCIPPSPCVKFHTSFCL